MALCGAVVLGLGYVRRRRFYTELARIVEDLDRTYFASELVEEPGFLEGRLAHEALEAVGKAAADDVAREAARVAELRRQGLICEDSATHDAATASPNGIASGGPDDVYEAARRSAAASVREELDGGEKHKAGM